MSGDGSGRTRTAHAQKLRGTDRPGLEKDDVGVGDRGTESGHRDVIGIAIIFEEAADKARSFREHVDHEDSEITASGQRLTDLFGPAEHHDRCILRQRMGELARCPVFVEFDQHIPDLGTGVTGAENAGAQPHQRRRPGMARDKSTTGGDQTLRIGGE
jgi:hypothetical protein